MDPDPPSQRQDPPTAPLPQDGREFFEFAPVSMWECHCDEVMVILEGLRAQGVTDLRAHLEAHPEMLRQALSLARFVDVNQASLRLFGARDKTEMLAALPRLFPPESQGLLREQLAALYEGRAQYEGEGTMRTLAGQPLEVQVRMRVLGQGRPDQRVLTSHIDLTQVRRAERSLGESERRLRQAFESSPAVKLMVEADGGDIVDVNEAACQFYGFGRHELTAMNMADIELPAPQPPPEGRPTVYPDPGFSQTQHRLASGEVRDVEVYSGLVEGGGRALLHTIVHDVTERNQIYQALRDSRARYRAIVDQQNEIICRFKPDGTLSFVNEAFCRYFAARRGEVIGTKFQLLVPEEDRERLQQLFDTLGPQYPLATIEHRVITPGGELAWQQWTNRAILDDQGGLIEIQSVGRDITERKATEEALRESEFRFMDFISSVPIGIFRASPEGRFSLVNPALARMIGLRSPSEVLTSVKDIAAQVFADAGEYGRMVSAVTAQAGWREFETRLRRRDREDFVVTLHIRAARDKAGAINYLEGFVEDITVRRRAEDELARHRGRLEEMIHQRTALLELANQGLEREVHHRRLVEEALIASEEKYRLLVENAGEAIFILQDGGVRFANPMTLALTGYDWPELAGLGPGGLFHPEDLAMLDEARGGGLFDCRVLTKGGEVCWVQLSSVELTWEGRPATLYLGRDITLQRALQTQALQRQKIEVLGMMAAGIAHDFNSSLGIIANNLDLAGRDLPPDGLARRALERSLKAAQRSKDLIKQLLAFRQLGQSQLRPVEIEPLLQETLDLLRSSLPAGVSLAAQWRAPGLVVRADPTQLHQVLLNLGLNAAQAMRDQGGLVEVVLEPYPAEGEGGGPDGQARLTVRDNGPGMEPGVVERIFDPFFSTKKSREGTGLGLSIVQGIVQEHGGAIVVESRPGQGSTFQVYLPCLEERPPLPAPAPASLPPRSAPHQAARVLLVDDDPDFLETQRQALGRMGHQVLGAGGPGQALEALAAAPGGFDLLLTDLNMPGMSGRELAEKAQKVCPGLPAIICTGLEEGAQGPGEPGGQVRAVVNKAAGNQELARVIDQVLAQGSGRPARKGN